jgi:predicted phosphodiesterase
LNIPIKNSRYKITFFFTVFLLCANITFAQQRQYGFSLNSKPVTNLQFNDDTNKLQFAIISDLWGGNRPGVFEDAVDKLNLLQPQFVISVGDLIDGKTHDATLIGRQWQDFTAKVNSLSMPFFYVPGNHDIGNADMEREWKNRFGKTYYYFIYKNVLFLCMNTQDGGVSGIKEDQINYFKKVIAANPDVRWTFIFMHRPVWQGDNQKEEGYEKIEVALKDRNYTLFSGHHHTYLYNVKNGKKHFVLGTTGGGIELRGEKFGEYDHVTWVTVNKQQPPTIINLKLNGLIKEDIVNEKTFPVTQTLINEDWITTPTFVLPNQFERSVSPEMIFSNPTSYPLIITGSLPKINGYMVTPGNLNITLPPKTKKTQFLTISSTDNTDVDLSILPYIDIELYGTYQLGKDTFQLPSKKRLSLDWQHVLSMILNAKKIADDQFENFDSAGFVSVTTPELQNKWYWYGTNDCLIKFRLTRDSKYLYLTAFIIDDQLVLGKNQDVLYIDVEDKNSTTTRLTIQPDVKESILTMDNKSLLQANDVTLKSKVNTNGMLRFLIQLPLDKIVKQDHSLRFNIGYRDQDNTPDIENSTLFWKPVWGSAGDYKNSGTYIVEHKDHD